MEKAQYTDAREVTAFRCLCKLGQARGRLLRGCSHLDGKRTLLVPPSAQALPITELRCECAPVAGSAAGTACD